MLQIFILAVVVEAIVEILVDSELFAPAHKWLKRLAYPEVPSNSTAHSFVLFIDSLVSCGYCLSVWVSGMVSVITNDLVLISNNTIINWIILTFLLHRLSNLFHVLYSLIKNGRIAAIDVKLDSISKHTIVKSDDNGEFRESVN